MCTQNTWRNADFFFFFLEKKKLLVNTFTTNRQRLITFYLHPENFFWKRYSWSPVICFFLYDMFIRRFFFFFRPPSVIPDKLFRCYSHPFFLLTTSHIMRGKKSKKGEKGNHKDGKKMHASIKIIRTILKVRK